MKNFALIGAAGYIAPRHMKAILETNNNLIAAYDPYDGIGIIDSYFPECSFFTEFERFDRFIEKLVRVDNKSVDYIVVTSPNYLHDAHIKFALRYGANVICEKPIVLNPHNLNQLIEIEKESKYKVYNILQLRLHPDVAKLKKKIDNEIKDNPLKKYEIDLTYITSRGKWYFSSWKGDETKSGGITTNIGIHFFDMLTWIFGDVLENEVYFKEIDTSSGFLKLKYANVRWFLSINKKFIERSDKKTNRSILVNSEELEFSEGFENLHTLSYEKILENEGFGILEAKSSLNIVSEIRNKKSIPFNESNSHPLLKKI